MLNSLIVIVWYGIASYRIIYC